MRLLHIATAAVVAAAIPINLLVDFGYSLLSLEVMGTAACFAIVAAVIGAMSANSFFYAYFLSLLIYLFAEIYYFNWTPAENVISVVLLFLLIFLFRITGARLLPYFLVFAAFFSLAAVFKPPSPVLSTTGEHLDRSINLDRSILHIVLDEMASPMVDNFPPTPGHPAESMLDDLAAQGFFVAAQAYSQSVRTVHSMSAIAALDRQKTQVETFSPGSVFSNQVPDNRYMRVLSELGYDVSILQSNYLDYCADIAHVYCQTFSRVGHTSSLSSAGAGERMKFAFVLLHEAMKSTTRTGVLPYFATLRVIRGSNPAIDSYVPLISYELMRGEVMDQVKAIEPGEVLFIHLLLPHFPYVYTDNCERLPIGEWGYPDRHTPQTDSVRSYAMYWDQVACVKETLSQILSVTAGKEFLTTIVHGDHGARVHWLTENDNNEDNLKTFLAVRSAGFEPGVETAPVNLQEAVIQVLKSFIQ